MRLIAAALLAAAAAGQPLEFTVLKEGVLQDRLRLAHPKNSERYARLKELFDTSGCGRDEREQPVKGSKQPNLICTVAGTGESDRRIIVGAHFDAIEGDGVVDNWSGAVLLPSLSEFLRNKPRHHTFEFVGFAAEEKGLLGSRAYVENLTETERKEIAAVITLDSLGLTPLKCWPNGSTLDLVRAAAHLAKAMNLDFTGMNVDGVGTTDSASFMDAHIPVLSLHSVTPETWKLINSRKDVWSAVSWKDYYDSHRFISALLVYLDRTLP